MELSMNSDTYLDVIVTFRRELAYVCQKVNEKYLNVKELGNMGIALRCLPDEIGRKTFKRYDKKSKYLTVDITVSLEAYKKLYKIEQRHELGHTIYANLFDALNKYKFETLDTALFLKDFKTWCRRSDGLWMKWIILWWRIDA